MTVDVTALLASLQIPPELIAAKSLVICPEATELVLADIGEAGREHLMEPLAADHWRAMRAAARADGVGMRIASAFRSVERQAEIVRKKLEAGATLESIFCVSAPPGYSEHHTGRAIDIEYEGSPAFEQVFAETPAFAWLTQHGGRFGFSMSFPRGNRYGYDYEPWHWCFHP